MDSNKDFASLWAGLLKFLDLKLLNTTVSFVVECSHGLVILEAYLLRLMNSMISAAKSSGSFTIGEWPLY